MTCTSSAAPTGRRPQTCSSGGIASRPAPAEADAALNHILTFLHWPPVNPGRFGPRRQRPGGSNTSDVMGSVLGRPGQHGWRLRYPSRLTLVWRLANSTAGPSTSGGRFVCWLVGSTTSDSRRSCKRFVGRMRTSGRPGACCASTRACVAPRQPGRTVAAPPSTADDASSRTADELRRVMWTRLWRSLGWAGPEDLGRCTRHPGG
jgi:hypothetical protein